MKLYVTILSVVLFASCFGLSCFAVCPAGDVTGDCKVDFTDFALLAQSWLVEGMQDIVLVDINIPEFKGKMSRYETTNAQYCQFLNAVTSQLTVDNGNVYLASDTNHERPYFLVAPATNYGQITYSNGIFSVNTRDGYKMDNHPVTQVSWYGAKAFCDYYGYRLPTDLEWQAVASYNHTQNYGCGTSIDPNKANYDMHNPLGLTSYPYTTPVGRYPSYGYGMNDMAGGVWEWTSTPVGDGHQYKLYGGSWLDNEFNCSFSSWRSDEPYYAFMSIGFRVCKD
jgi:formylglycine-generating enzyme required for sulfatase activity